ncbi:hypothetical protein ANN_27801, partial [Periplaneta americana]
MLVDGARNICDSVEQLIAFSNDGTLVGGAQSVCRGIIFFNNDSTMITQRVFSRHFEIGRNGKIPTLQMILNWLRQFRTTASVRNKRPPGRPQTVRTPEYVQRVAAAFQRSAQHSARRHSVVLHLTPRTVRYPFSKRINESLHNHASNVEMISAKRTVTNVRRNAREHPEELPARTVRENLAEVEEGVLTNLPQRNFLKPLINSLHQCKSSLSGQSVYRTIQARELQPNYDNPEDRTFRDAIHQVLSLAFVPEDDIPQAFDELYDQVPDAVIDIMNHFNGPHLWNN